MPLVTGGGNDPVSLDDDVERRGISGTGAPTTEMNSQVSTTELMYNASYRLCRHYINAYQLRQVSPAMQWEQHQEHSHYYLTWTLKIWL